MIPKDETFNGTWPYLPNFCDAAGFQQHYVDIGEGEPTICLHGEPTWGYLYRNMIPKLAANTRVIVPDHMGFGKSETPADREYTLQAHTENLTALIDSLELEKITFVMQDWGGPIGTAYTVRHSTKVKRLIYMNTIAGYGRVPETTTSINNSPWFKWIGEGLESGRTEQVLRNAGSTVLSIMKIIGFQNSNVIDDVWIEAYSSPFPDYQSSIGVYEFPIDAYLGRIVDYVLDGASGVPDLQSKPAILLEGLEDRAIPPDRAIAGFKSLWPDAPVIELPGVGHFCQEDAPDLLVSHILRFFQTNP
ncbi:MAG: alpha/beta fold hydrolase [Acidimicrobiales bacterium]|nr:alpha/beta fold hydrolase [Acidimicrobiales bacterium]